MQLDLRSVNMLIYNLLVCCYVLSVYAHTACMSHVQITNRWSSCMSHVATGGLATSLYVIAKCFKLQNICTHIQQHKNTADISFSATV